jgi:hypothetical protein
VFLTRFGHCFFPLDCSCACLLNQLATGLFPKGERRTQSLEHGQARYVAIADR